MVMIASSKVTSVPGIRRFHFDCLHYPKLMDYGYLSLLQLGDLNCDSGFVLGPHKQGCYEITYVVSGRGWFETNGTRFNLSAGDIYIGKPGETHQGAADAEDPFRYFYFGFRFKRADGENPFQPIRDMMDHAESPVCRDRLDLRAPFVHVLKEMSSETQYSYQMIQTYLEQIIVLTYRNFCSQWEAKYLGEGSDNAGKRLVYSAIHYIDDRLLQIRDLKEISDAFGYSQSYLSRLFSKETGDSLHRYYVKKKWSKVTDILKEGIYSITEIAEMMQYESIHSFSRAFRKEFGVSPSQYVWEQKAVSRTNPGHVESDPKSVNPSPTRC